MASKRFDAVTTQGLQRVRVVGSFQTNGASDPVTTTGNGFTVARTGEGTYAVSLSNVFFACDCVSASLAQESPGTSFAQTSHFDMSSNSFNVHTFIGEQAQKSVGVDLLSGRILVGGAIQALADSGGIIALDSSLVQADTISATNHTARISFEANDGTAMLRYHLPLPVDCDRSQPASISLTGAVEGSTDVVAVDVIVQAYSLGTTDLGSTTAEFDDAAVVTATADVDLSSVATNDALSLVIKPQSHTTDAIFFQGITFRYVSLQESLVAGDIDEADNAFVNFDLTMRNTGVNY